MENDTPSRPASADGTRLTIPPSFPVDEYTPHGYLAIPCSDAGAGRGGVVRSVPPLGFGYWLRSFKGSSGSIPPGDANYLSVLKLTFACEDLQLVGVSDFASAGINLVSRYHTKHMMSYDWACGGLTFSVRYFLPREDTLACLIEVANAGPTAKDVIANAIHVYGLWETPWQGSDGLDMLYVPDADAGVSTIFARGDSFAIGANVRSIAHKATGQRGEVPRWLRGNDLTSADAASVRGPGPLHTIMSYKLAVPAQGRTTALICLSRGDNGRAALAELRTSLAEAVSNLKQQLDRDEAFWSRCQRLDGDWPAVWKRGWVYDRETLRIKGMPDDQVRRRYSPSTRERVFAAVRKLHAVKAPGESEIHLWLECLRNHPHVWQEQPRWLASYVDRAQAAGLHKLAGEAVADIADRIYPRLDCRTVRFDDQSRPFAYRVPGVACENWPISDDVEPGYENSAAGATLPLHIIRSIVGFREPDKADARKPEDRADVEFLLTPALPQRLMMLGRSYWLRNLALRGIDLNIRYVVENERRRIITLDYVSHEPVTVAVRDQSGQPVVAFTAGTTSDLHSFSADNGQVLVVRFKT